MDPFDTPEQRASPPRSGRDRATRPGAPAPPRYPRGAAVLALALAALGLAGCDRLYERVVQRMPWDQLPPPPDSTVFWPETLLVRAERADRESALAVGYQPYVVGDKHAVWKLRLGVGEDRFRTTLQVSRTDIAHVQKGDTLLVPTKAGTPLISPYPDELPSARTLPKLLMVSLRVQAYGAYEYGELERWGPTSTGRRNTPTQPGIYFANWKSKEKKSSVDSSWVLKWEVNLDAMEGVAIHEYGLPGRPASHSCVRLTQEDAEWFFDWVQGWGVSRKQIMRRGTPVVIFGGYNYDQRRPWMRLPVDVRATHLSDQELEDTVAAYFFCGPPMPEPDGPPMPPPRRSSQSIAERTGSP